MDDRKIVVLLLCFRGLKLIIILGQNRLDSEENSRYTEDPTLHKPCKFEENISTDFIILLGMKLF